MNCKFCGAPADEIKPGEFHCNYCNNSFAVKMEEPKTSACTNHEISSNTNTSANTSRIMSGEEIYEQAIKSVVEIYASNPKSNSQSCASGFVVSTQGFVITNAHAVIDETGGICSDIKVKSQQGTFSAVVVAIGKPADSIHNNVDLCLLYAAGLCSIKPDNFANMENVKNGQNVYLIGNSLGMGSCITSGIISDRARAIPGLNYSYIMTDVAANHGNSGGPLYNDTGEVIGVLVAGIDRAEGMNYAIPVNVLDSFMQYIFKNSDIDKAKLDVFEKYKNTPASYGMSLSIAFAGVRLALDVIEYIVGLFRKK
jgi:serine protease Do